jgi:CDP-diacylglycerol---glycerol-3-phosphate 3-phosphatidyltransferase
MGIYAIKPKFQRLLRPVEDVLVRLKIHPTYINLFGLLSALTTSALLIKSPQTTWLLFLIPLPANTRTACNALDGLVARRLKVADNFGEVLNEFIDRVSDTAIFTSIILLKSTNDRLGLAVLIVILLNSYLSILSKAAGGSRQYGGVMGKADRMIYVSIAAVIIGITKDPSYWNYFLIFVLAGTFVTLIQRFITTYRELQTHGK